MLEIIWKANYKLLEHGNSDGYIASEARNLCKAVKIHISSHLIYMVAIASATKRQEKRCPNSLRDKRSGRKYFIFSSDDIIRYISIYLFDHMVSKRMVWNLIPKCQES
jgi:hypothetical protein